MANPPITIGPFTNVPAPGSAIQSAWAQSISTWVSRQRGCLFSQAGQTFNGGTAGTITWGVETFDPDGMGAVGNPTLTIPANQGGTWAITCAVKSTPGAPSAACNLTLNTNPGRQVSITEVLLAGQLHATLSVPGIYLAGGAQFSVTFGNNHPTAVILVAEIEARWVAP